MNIPSCFGLLLYGSNKIGKSIIWNRILNIKSGIVIVKAPFLVSYWKASVFHHHYKSPDETPRLCKKNCGAKYGRLRGKLIKYFHFLSFLSLRSTATSATDVREGASSCEGNSKCKAHTWENNYLK